MRSWRTDIPDKTNIRAVSRWAESPIGSETATTKEVSDFLAIAKSKPLSCGSRHAKWDRSYRVLVGINEGPFLGAFVQRNLISFSQVWEDMMHQRKNR